MGQDQEIDIREEVNRKALETLEGILLDHDNGSVPSQVTGYALTTLFGVTSGIITGETFEIISEASKEFRHLKDTPQTRMFLGQDLVTVTIVQDAKEMLIRRFEVSGKGLQSVEKRIAFGDPAIQSRSSHFRLICDSLVKRGYTEL